MIVCNLPRAEVDLSLSDDVSDPDETQLTLYAETPFKQGAASPKNRTFGNVRLAPPPVHIVLY